MKIVRLLSWDTDAADWYAVIRHQLPRTGQRIGEIDMMIAAHALSAGAVLVAMNQRHYEKIDGPLNFWKLSLGAECMPSLLA